MRDYPKPIKRRIRELAEQVYEKKLSEALTRLEGDFAKWRAGQLDAFELEQEVHKFHDGAARELWKQYSPASGAQLEQAALAS